MRQTFWWKEGMIKLYPTSGQAGTGRRSEAMAVQIQIREETVQACLSGEIDHHSAAQMREKIDESVIQSGAKTLVLDFSLVTFMDSSGIGLVMGRFRLMQENGGELVLQNLPAPLRKVMKLAGLDKLAKFQ